MGRMMDASELLMTRRSIRAYEKDEIDEPVLHHLFEFCKYSPTSMNSGGYYFVVIKDRTLIHILGSVRGSYSDPIKQAPIAVAICVDPTKTKRVVEDGVIAAYHFMLSAWALHLGTCYIGGMDRDDVKEYLGIPSEHYVATVTPLGHPMVIPDIPLRNDKNFFVKYI